MKNATKNEVAKKLSRVGVVTMSDLDAYRFAHAVGGVIDSRYGTLKAIVGERAADVIMRELEVASW